jgi:mycothiol synthase
MSPRTADLIRLPQVPPIDGLRFRHYAGEPDITGLVELWNAAYRADDVELVWTDESLRVELAHPTNHDPTRDMIVGEIGDRIVGVGTAHWFMRDGEYQAELDGAVMPEYRRRGIGRAILRWSEHRAAEVAEENGAAPRWLGAWKNDSQVGDIALLGREGYAPVRYFFEMERDLSLPIPDAPVPEGLEIRPVRDADERRIFEAENEAFRDHWGHREFVDADFARQVASPEHDTSLWQVAWDGDEVVGAVSVWIYPEENRTLGVSRAWLERVSVRRRWRRRGVARSLIAAAMRAIRVKGLATAALGVDADNPTGALGLYEGLGFGVHKRGTAWRKAFDPDAR